MAYGDRLKKGADSRLTLLDKLKLILEQSHNSFTFRGRCKTFSILIEKKPDGSIVASYSDDRDGSITIDLAEPPFDRIRFFCQQ